MATTPAERMAHLDVAIVGAGLSGIGAGHYLQTECPWAEYAIFEARDGIGGTWDLFRYPGIRSDSDMHTLGYSFRPWDGEKSIADGDSILQYIKDTARESGVDTHIRFNHRITAANWSTPDSLWRITAERTDTQETFEFTASFLFSCSGYYRYDHGYLPDFEGMADFAGTIVHPQAWPDGLDVAGKRVVVIGSGATAVTLVPALAQSASHVTMLQRSPTYIASLPEKSPVVGLLRKVLPAQQAGTAAKWFHALLTQAFYGVSRKYPKLVRRMLSKGLERQLPPGLRHRHPLHAPLQPMGPALLRRAERRPLQGALQRGRIGGHRPDRALHRKRASPLVGRRTRGGHHRDRHRSRAALPRRHRRSVWTVRMSTLRPGSPTRG